MTREEAVARIKDHIELHRYNERNQVKVIEALDMAIKALEQIEQRWILCSERMPEVGQKVLFSVGGMYTAEGCLRADGEWAQYRWDGISLKDNVVAWMPMPEED